MADTPLLSVTAMQVDILASDPPRIAIAVQGHAATPGWTNPRLVPEAEELSPDGILDLTFAGTPPTGIVPQVLTPVSASILWTREAERVVGIRVVSRTDTLFRFVNPVSLPGAGDPCRIADLKGRPLRVIHPGDAVTTDFIPDRVNIEVDARNRIERVWFG